MNRPAHDRLLTVPNVLSGLRLALIPVFLYLLLVAHTAGFDLVDAGEDDGPFHAATAYVLATNGAKVSTADNIQNHGGIGLEWEHDAHLYLKRSFLLEHVPGAPRATYEAVLAPARHDF